MDDAPARFWFDYVDPVSLVVEVRLRRVETRLGITVARQGWEIAPPPTDPPGPGTPVWRGRWEEVAPEARAEGLDLIRPNRVPWSRKAHELALHAAGETPAASPVHDALFRAYHMEGRDIGRIDVLVEIAEGCGLDPGEVRTVLGVDRYLPRVRDLREAAERQGVRGVPTVARGGRSLEGLTDEESLATFLAA